MSSLSREDLDAGWDSSDAVGTDEQSAVPGYAQSVPPNSITVQKPSASRESLVVPAGSRRAQESCPEVAERSSSSVFSSSILGWANAHRRAIWLAAAIFGFVFGIRGFRAKAHRSLNRLPTTVIEQAQLRLRGSLIPAARPFEQVSSGVASDTRRASEQKGITLSDSFSDVFLKHAATADSSWLAIKKRPRPSDALTTKRPVPNASPSRDNPLNVLDQLEKARKAKKQAPNMPQ